MIKGDKEQADAPIAQLRRIGVYGIARKSDKILVITQEKGVYKGKFDLPGGGIEFGEKIEQALRREFIEEVGMEFGKMELLTNLTTLVNHPTLLFHQIGLIYLVEELTNHPNSSPELRYEWMELQRLNQKNSSPFLDCVLNFLI